MTDTDHSSEPTITVEHRLPRTLDAYEPTDHFLERLKYRTDPAPSEQIVRECLEHGRIKPTHYADRYIFEDDRGLRVWWVLVRAVEAAFREADSYHELLTVYAPDSHDADHPTVFDEEITTDE